MLYSSCFDVVGVTGNSPFRGNVDFRSTKGLPSPAKGLNLGLNRVAFATQTKRKWIVSTFFLFLVGVTGFSPVRPYPINSGCPLFTLKGNLQANFLLNSSPFICSL